MLMALDEIGVKITSGEITAISLDTSIFEKSHNRFEHAPLAQLKQFRDSSFQLLVSDVVAGEVKSHVIRDGNTSESEVRSAFRKIGEKWQVTREVRDAAVATLLGGETSEAMFDRRFAVFAKETGLIVVESEPLVKLGRVLDDYFSAKPPFATNEVKKSEFPDAIALHALENLAKARKTKFLIVAKDNDWKSFCESSPSLVLVDELGDALTLFHQAENVIARCAQISSWITAGEINIDSDIETAIQNSAEGLNFVPEANAAYYYDPDVESVEVEKFELLPRKQHGEMLVMPVDNEEDYLVVEARARVSLAVVTSFSFSVTDSIDRDEVPMGSTSETQSIEVMAKVFLTFEGDFSSAPALTDVEVEFERGTYDVDYGEVGPDWSDYEE